jgi:rhodanese-related sulfurtransferase
MRTLLFAIAIGTAAIGCSKSDNADSAKVEGKVASVSIEELDGMMAKGHCSPVDANGDATRKKMGVIPGAVLLTDSDTYKPEELPNDKSRTLVFYCANTKCGASHDAANRAILAGHKDVKVLPDGIAGWVKAGKKVQTGG